MFSGCLAAWREVKAIVLSLMGLTLLALWAQKRWLVWLLAGLLGWIFYFFRDPERTPVSTAPEFIFAPADGRVMAIELVDEPYFFKGPARCISIFLSLFDVHLQRSPCEGQVQYLRYQTGGFAPAFLKNARCNESNLIGLRTPQGPVAVKQIAGILARRIVCWTDPGETLAAGQRLGLIKFGSRVDLLLPPAVEVLVAVGQQVYGGQTIVAKWNDCSLVK